MSRASVAQAADGEIDRVAGRLRDRCRVTMLVRRRGAPIVDARYVRVVFPGDPAPVEVGQEELAALLLLDARGEVSLACPFVPGVGGRRSAETLVSAEVKVLLRRLAGLPDLEAPRPRAGTGAPATPGHVAV